MHRTAAIVTAVAVVGLPVRAAADGTPTAGLMLDGPEAFPGYTLFTPLQYPTTYLIDNQGRLVHSWPGTTNHHMVELLPNGQLLRTGIELVSPVFSPGRGGNAGRVELVDWDGTVAWTFKYSNDQVLAHHDVQYLPNGNVLVIAWEVKSEAEAIAEGRDPALISEGALWPDFIVEVEPTPPVGGNIVWEWHVWDHLVQDFDATKANYDVVADHPELIDLNFINAPIADWNHANAIHYHAGFDQVVLSVRSFSEIWVIDHGTTTAEAAGHTGGRRGKGGDLLYRWGNPRTYRLGTAADRQLFFQHDAQWIPAGLPGEGNITVFNNGPRPTVLFSSLDELATPVTPAGDYIRTPGTAWGPAAPTWQYTASPTTAFYSRILSGVSRLPNGNALAADGWNGVFFEVTPDQRKVWEYVMPVVDTGPVQQCEPVPGGARHLVHRARRYAPDYPGLVGRDLSPKGPIELYVLLRNGDVTTLTPPSPPLDTIFTGAGLNTLDRARDEHIYGFAAGDVDDDPAVCSATQPLLFYQVNRDTDELMVTKDGACSVRVYFQ